MKKTIRFLDCGANIGQSIDWAIEVLSGYDFKIDSFEPNPSLMPIIKDRFFNNKEKINLHQVAIDVIEREKTFYLQDWGARTGSSLVKGKESTIHRVGVIGQLCYVEQDGTTVKQLKVSWNKEEFEKAGTLVDIDEPPVFVQYMPSEALIEILNDPKYTIENEHELFNTVEVQTINFPLWLEENINEDELIILKLDIEGTEFEVVDKIIKSGLNEKIDVLLVEWTPEQRMLSCSAFVSGVDERIELRKLTKEKFRLVLDWKKPEECKEPVKNFLKEKENA
tara:strand:+ start:450 stop:1289 length:840 start_codon:yes stop_codon:yes gene_type:complete